MTAVQVRQGRVAGTAQVPGSKSVTHRALLLAAQSQVPCVVEGPLLGADTRSTVSCLHALGARVSLGPDTVRFTPAPLVPPRHPLDCGNSGTTLRLLAATCARLAQPVTLDGDASLRQRPNQPLLDALMALGATARGKDGRAPLSVRGPLMAGNALLPGGVSSQYASALLLSLPFLEGASTLHAQLPLQSAPYLDVTVQVARQAGLRIEADAADGRTFSIPGSQRVTASTLRVDGDWSTAAILLGAAAVSRGEVTVTGLDHASPQGDKAILGFLRSFGAKVQTGDGSATVSADSLASPGTLDVSQSPDLFPILCVLAAVATGTTTLAGAQALRDKESDRIAAMAQGLARMGIHATETPSSLAVHGGSLRGARVASMADHRIHMAFCVAGLAANGITTVDDPACAAVSFPGFHEALRRLGAPITLAGTP